MKKILFLFVIVILIDSCRKDPEFKSGLFYDPTPASVDVPAFVANYAGAMPVPADNPLTIQGIALGRKLFYEKMLSNTSTISCASCHKQENAFDDPRPFSQGTNGSFGNRNAMAIINPAWGNQFFWDGRRPSLEGQAHDPVTNPIEMANTWHEVVSRLQKSSVYPGLFYNAFGTNTIDSDLVFKAIAQFERTLVSFNSRFDKYFYENDTTALNAQEKRGMLIFTTTGFCTHCHQFNALLTDGKFVNNGLDDNPLDPGLAKFTGKTNDVGKFKTPTLRNIELTAPYMHDSRFKTLEEVVDHYSENVRQNSPNIDQHMKEFGSGLHLTVQQKADLVAFLKTFTDKNFTTNPAFSDPGN